MAYDERDEVVVVERGGGPGGQFAAFLIGAAVGAGIALLYAPQSGAKTRAQIARQTKRARQAAMDVADDVRSRTVDAYDDARDRVAGAYGAARDDLRRRGHEIKRRVDGAVEDVKHRAEAGVEAGKTGARAAREELNRRLAEGRADEDGDDA